MGGAANPRRGTNKPISEDSFTTTSSQSWFGKEIMTIFVTTGGLKRGPFTLDELNQEIQVGRIEFDSSLAWFEGCDNWIPIRMVPGVLPPTPPANDPMAIWAFVLSLLGLLCCGIILSVPAVIMGHRALSNVTKNKQLQGRGLAIAAVAIGYVTTAFWLMYLLFFGGFAILASLAK